jgi:hypothetical protein
MCFRNPLAEPASPYTYSSSTHRFPDERTPIEATPLSATSTELGLGWGLGLGLDSLSHSSSHALPFFSPPSFHTLCLSPRSLVCGGQPSPHKPRLVVSHITCPPLSSSPRAQLCIRYYSNKPLAGFWKTCGIGLFYRNYRSLVEETRWLGCWIASVCLKTR